MAVAKERLSTQMALKYLIGADTDNPKNASMTLKNLKEDAPVEKINEVAKALGNLLAYDVTTVAVTEASKIYDIEG